LQPNLTTIRLKDEKKEKKLREEEIVKKFLEN
jgi:hypothetical protein